MDVSDISNFSARGRGRGSPKHQEGGGVRFLLKIPGGRGVSQERFRCRDSHQVIINIRFSDFCWIGVCLSLGMVETAHA